MVRSSCAAAVLLAALGATAVARADEPPPLPPPAGQPAPAEPARAGQGVAIVAGPGTRDDAFVLARAAYAGTLRPRRLDEARARVLAGDAAPEGARRELRELGELRAAVVGEDAASRRLLASIADQVGAAGLLVVLREPPPSAGGDAGAPSPGAVSARLYLAEVGEFDAARYAPETGPAGSPAWDRTVASLERRFAGSGGAGPAPAVAAPAVATAQVPEAAGRRSEGESRPFYASPWFWGSLGAAALLGGGFYFASRDSGSETIHLQMHLPR